MSIMISENKEELIVTCECGCDNAIHIRINGDDKEDDCYAIQTYMNGNWYRDQENSVFRCIVRKLKKIWSIIRNKDFHYSEILISREDFQRYKDYINQF